MLRTPRRGNLNAAQTVYVSFLLSQGEGAASWETAMKMIHETHEKHEEKQPVALLTVNHGNLIIL